MTHSRALLAGVLDELLKHTQELGDAISDAVTADARVGACPKCGKDTVEDERQDPWQLHWLHGLARLRCDLSGAERRQGKPARGRGGRVPRVRRTAH